MGNRQGHRKDDGKAKGDKKSEKKADKDRKKTERNDKKDKRKLGQNVSDMGTDIEESSHVTGGDSESCVFHSAENVSSSAASTLHDQDHGTACKGTFDNPSTVTQHPQVLSSKDFQDGFSLEACIPPEIARPETCNVLPSTSWSQQRTTKPSSFNVSQSESAVKIRCDGSLSPFMGKHDHQTSITTALCDRVTDRPHQRASPASNSSSMQDTDRDGYQKVPSSPSGSSYHHPHFYNHHQDRQNQNTVFPVVSKPSSPHPQRRILSPKVKLPLCKLLSSGSVSPASTISTASCSPTSNHMTLVSSGSKLEKGAIHSGDNTTEPGAFDAFSRRNCSTNDTEVKVKNKPIWKTWERSHRVKSQTQTNNSIFGTSRKMDQQTEKNDGKKESTDEIMREEMKQIKASKKTCENSVTVEFEKDIKKERKPDSTSANLSVLTNSQVNSSGSECVEWKLRNRVNDAAESWTMCPESSPPCSPPLTATAAFCILKLEELERSLEKTIREKFPDSEPLLLRKRSKEELSGSRSLPTTPSLKKKLYAPRDHDTIVVNDKSTTRFCDETYESPPSAAKSPVVLRRFGIRTRHASMSPKIQRAKTAALFNSPSELSGFDTMNIESGYHGLSNQQTQGTTLADTLLSAAKKSDSKYDNVIDAADDNTSLSSSDCYLTKRHGSPKSTQIDPSIAFDSNGEEMDLKQVIVPTFSAVFGSVSPKLKRHRQVKFNESNREKDKSQGNISSLDDSYSKKTFNNQLGEGISYNNTILSNQSSRSHKFDKYTTDGQDPSVSRLDSSETGPEPIRQNQTGNEGSSMPSQPLDNTHGTENRQYNKKDKRVTEVAIRSDIKCMPKVRTVSDEDAGINDEVTNGLTVRLNEERAGQYCHGMKDKKPNSLAVKESSVYGEASSLTEPQEIRRAKITNKPGHLTSDIALKPPTDHVVLSSSVALPCRALSPGSCEETASDAHSTHRTHAQPGNKLWNARKDNPDGTNNSNLQFSCISASPLSDNVGFHSTTPANSSNTELVEDIPLKHDDSLAIINNKRDEASLVMSSAHVGSSAEITFNLSSSVFTDNSRSDSYADSPSGFKNEQTREVSDQNDNRSNRQHQTYLEHERRLKQRHRRLEDHDTLPVLKQPVSEVISHMINLSKRQPQQQEIHPKLRQTNVIALELNTTHSKPADTLVTIANVVPADTTQGITSQHAFSNSRINASQHLLNSRCQEIQTDSYTTADKSVDSDGLTETLGNSRISTIGQSLSFLTSINDSQSIEEENNFGTDDSAESRYSRILLTGKETGRRKNATESKRSDQVPPSSPTAMQQLLEELEETEDDITNEEAAETVSKHEIKQFTDLIFKRLSDLLGSHARDEETIDEDVCVKDSADADTNFESETESLPKLTYPDSTCEGVTNLSDNASRTMTNSSASTLLKVLTVETSSSLTTTTTSSDSEGDQTQMLFQSAYDKVEDGNGQNTEYYKKRDQQSEALMFRDCEVDVLRKSNDDAGQTQTSREYHSDDDVVTGRGIPDYYDDRPLWSRREKAPGQLSATMMAVRWRERRERWLKKRRRNKTDLMSTGSSDTGSEKCFSGDYSRIHDSSNYVDDDKRRAHRSDLGSGILTSPKYTKPIIPFFDSGHIDTPSDETSAKAFSGHLQTSNLNRHRYGSRSPTSSHLKHRQRTKQKNNSEHVYQDDKQSGHESGQHGDKQSGHESGQYGDKQGGHESGQSGVVASSCKDGATIEDTFHELMSVQNILKEMQDWRPAIGDSSERKCLPLTTENVRSIREYYKDCYSSGNGRRSRMSATDRTESDLDLYSEIRDDESSDSQVYADDEEDDEGLEPYATADDDLGAASLGNSTGGRSSGAGTRGDEDDTTTSILLSCTFYNSNTQPGKVSDTTEVEPPPVSLNEVKTVSSARASASPGINSDDEFWTGSVLVDESYKQLEAAADAVSSTFQNAREQMHDIQYHLQALRRQMEVMQVDLTTISTNISPTKSSEYIEKSNPK